MLMEQINYNLLFRWFVGLPMDAEVWHATVFTHNRDRLLEAEMAREHFSVDGTLMDAWASMKSLLPKDDSGESPSAGRNGERDFHKEKRLNETHASTTDRDARLYRKAERAGEPVVLHGARADGEPKRSCGRCDPDACDRDGGTGSRACHAQPAKQKCFASRWVPIRLTT